MNTDIEVLRHESPPGAGRWCAPAPCGPSGWTAHRPPGPGQEDEDEDETPIGDPDDDDWEGEEWDEDDDEPLRASCPRPAPSRLVDPPPRQTLPANRR